MMLIMRREEKGLILFDCHFPLFFPLKYRRIGEYRSYFFCTLFSSFLSSMSVFSVG